MRTIYTQVSKQFIRSLMTQLIFAGLVLSLALFALIGYQSYQAQNHHKTETLRFFTHLAQQESRLLYQKLDALGATALMLSTQSEAVLSRPNDYENNDFSLIKDGRFYRNDRLGRFTFYAEQASMGPIMRRKAQRFSLGLPLLQTGVEQHQTEVERGWIYLDDPLSLTYPPLENMADAGTGHDLMNSPVFELFIKNPRRQWRYISAGEHNNSSALMVAPVFDGENLVGIAGFSLSDRLFDSLLQSELPAGSFLAVYNRLTGKTFSSQKQLPFNPAALLSNPGDETYTVAHAEIDNTPLTVLIGAQTQTILAADRALYFLLLWITLGVVAFVAAFYAVFFRMGRARVQALAKSLSTPLNEIVRFSHHLGMRSAGRLEPTGVTELDDLSNHLHLAHSKLMQMLIVDELTGTYNRRKLLMDLDGRGPFGLIAMNINRFKYLNDIYGYAAGDYVLKRTVELLGDLECEGCEIYRIGGDEFAVLLPTADLHLLKAHAENMGAAISNSLFLFNDVEMEVSVSIGVAAGVDKDGAKLLSKADIALSKAREVKQMPVMVYTPDLEINKDYETNLYWEKRIKDAIRMGTMVPWYQPIMDIATGKIMKFEALVRIVEKGDAVPPYYFLEAARKTGALYEIARRMIAQTFEMAAQYDDIEFSINLSLTDFSHPELLPYISEQLAKAKLDAGRITFEVLETEAMHEEDSQVQNAIMALKKRGFKVAIDDFGSGYSNFARFVDLKVDYLKIDGQFIRNLHRDETSRHALKAILEFAAGTGAKTVAEYVETRRAYEAVKRFPIDYAQGFFISKPVPAAEVDALIKR